MAQDLSETSRLAAPRPSAHERDPLQRCRNFIPGLRNMPWWDSIEFSAAGTLQENYQVIRSEFLNLLLCGQLRLHPQSKGGPRMQISDGDWNIFELMSGGRANAASKILAPNTSRAVMSLPEVTTNPNGLAYFSVLNPGVHVQAHCGPTNSRIRIHFGLLVPQGAVMRVGTETRPWQEGTCVVFDDSWEHEVFNQSEFVRAVLLLDVWHPDLTADQVGKIISSRPPGKARQKQRAGWLDAARVSDRFAGPSLYSLVGPRQLGRMVASASKARDTDDHALRRLRAFAAESLDPGVAVETSVDGADISRDLWSSLASLVDRQPRLLSPEDLINIIHIGSVCWRSSAGNELLGWEFMEESTAEARERLFTAPRLLTGVREILQWCHEEGKTLAPLSAVAAAAALAIQAAGTRQSSFL
jgi:aspartyl/asparaginyl beta-hydroxylase (cupin superfamily)